jgi:hypothetical protein
MGPSLEIDTRIRDVMVDTLSQHTDAPHFIFICCLYHYYFSNRSIDTRDDDADLQEYQCAEKQLDRSSGTCAFDYGFFFT